MILIKKNIIISLIILAILGFSTLSPLYSMSSSQNLKQPPQPQDKTKVVNFTVLTNKQFNSKENSLYYDIANYFNLFENHSPNNNQRVITVSLSSRVTDASINALRYAVNLQPDSESPEDYYYTEALSRADLEGIIEDVLRVWNNALGQRVLLSFNSSLADSANIVIHLGGADYGSTLLSPDYLGSEANSNPEAPPTPAVAATHWAVESISNIEIAQSNIMLVLPDNEHNPGLTIYENTQYIQLNLGAMLDNEQLYHLFPSGTQNNTILANRFIASFLIRHELGHALGLDHTDDPGGLYTPFITNGDRAISPIDPVLSNFEIVFPNLANYYAEHPEVPTPPIPASTADVVRTILLLESNICASQCTINSTSSRSDNEELKCLMKKKICRTMQISTSGDINRRFKNIDFSFYVKDAQGNKKHDLYFGNTGSDDVMGAYTGNVRYYFPYGYDTVYFQIADTPGSKEIPMTIHNVPTTKDLHTTLMYNAGTRKVDHSIQIPIKDELKNTTFYTDEQNNMLKGTGGHIFGIDLDISIKFGNYDLYFDEGSTWKVVVELYYKAYGELYGENNWQKWRGGSKGLQVARCEYDKDTSHIRYDLNYYRPTGQCLITIPRVFLPKGTHEIILLPHIYKVDHFGDYPISDTPAHHQTLKDYSNDIGGYGLQLDRDDPARSIPRIIGILQHDTIGVTKFKRYRKDYPMINQNARFCTWPWC